MKKYFNFMLALIAVFAIIMGSCGGSDSSSPSKITITFNTDGGSAVDSIEINEGGSLPADYFGTGTKVPTKTGNRFNGWKNGADAVTEQTTFSTGTELTAQWIPTRITVTFSLGEVAEGIPVEGTPPNSFVIDNGTAPGNNRFPSNNPVRDGFDFDGWYNGDTRYSYNTVINSTAATFPLTAKWELNYAPENAQNPAIHPGKHFLETDTGEEISGARVDVTFSSNGLFSNVEPGAGVLSSKWYRVTSEADANSSTAANPKGTVIFEQNALAANPHELALPFSWKESEAGTYWYYVVVTNTNVNATERQTSSSITQDRLKVTVVP